MTEFVINSEQLERLIEGIEHNTGRKINQVIYDGTELPVIVRCKDCKHFCEDRRDTSIGWVDVFVCNADQWSTASLMPMHSVKPEGFCAWGERRES